MKLAINIFLLLVQFFREGAGSEGCDEGWRRVGGRCVGRGSELRGSPSGGGPHLPPSGGGSHLPPSGGGPHLSPSGGGPHFPLSGGGFHLSPSGDVPHLPPSGGGPHLPPSGGGPHLPLSGGGSHLPPSGDAAQGFEGAQGACVSSDASLLLISLADISELLTFPGWSGQETYFWVGGVDDQTTASGRSHEIFQQTDEDEEEEEEDTGPCWAARFQALEEFIELTRAPCETALDFLCQKPLSSNCSGSQCEQLTKVRVKRQVRQDPFQPSFGDALSVGSWPNIYLPYNHLHHALHNDPYPRSYPFAPVTFSPDSSDHPLHSLIVPHLNVPNHQGGNAVRLGSLFATNRGDRSNLRTERTPLSTPRQGLPNAEGLDFTDNLQSKENYAQGTKTSRSGSLANPTSSPVVNSSRASNQINGSYYVTSSAPMRSTTVPSTRPRGHQIVFLPQTTRKLRFVTPGPVVQFTTKGSNRADPGDAASAGGVSTNGCISAEHRALRQSCYALIRKRDSFMNGLNACMNIHPQAHSAIVSDQTEGDFLKLFHVSEGVSVWLGLHRRDTLPSSAAFRWLDDSALTYANWAPREPAKVGDCVYASSYSRGIGAWFAEDCNAACSMLCEYPRNRDAELSAPASSNAMFSRCADGWTFNSKTYSCYKLMKHGGQTQAVAESNCQLYGGHLVSIGSEDEANFIRKVVESSNFAYTTFWVGLHLTENGHEWVDGSAAGYVRWRRGQPDSHHGRETCVTAYKRTMELSDTYCQAYFAYMCKVPAGMSTAIPELGTVAPAPPCPSGDGWVLHKDNCYKIFSKRNGFFKTWEQARQLCRNSHASLASVLDEEENAFMLSQVYTLPDEVMWLGGHASQDGGYTWTDGAPFLFINWKAGEPNNLHDQESCLSMYPGDEAYWNDDNCGILAGWVCKKPVVESSTTSTTPSSNPVGFCGQDWVNTGKKCIKLYEKARTFEDARRICKMESDGDLVSIANVKDQAVISALVGPVDRGVWLGMAYADVYRWVDQSPVHYTNWAPGEPNNNFLTRNKAIITIGSHIKNGLPAFNFKNPIPYSNLRNLFVPHILERIRSIESGRSQSPVHRREKRFSSDDDGRRPEDCVEMHSNIRGNKWNDVQCDALLPFVCQKPQDPTLESPGAPALCEEPFASYLNYSGACYRLVTGALPWQDADAKCRSEGAELISVETISENAYAYLLAQAEHLQKVWIGFRYVNRSDRFEWSDGHPVLYTSWAPEEPKTEADDESKMCVSLSTQQVGEWQTDSCDQARPFLCKYRPGVIPTPDTSVPGSCPSGQWADLGGSFCYFVHEKDHFTWNKANSECQKMSSELVSVHSSVEMEYMARLVAHHHVSLWTGLIRGAQTFVWSDGSPYDYTHWAPFEPNGADEKCVEMMLAERVWNDISCSVLRGFVCKIAKVPYPETTPGPEQSASLERLSQRQGAGSQLGKGGIVALVLASSVLVAAIGYVLYTYKNHLRISRPAVRPAAATSFDNALYNPDSLEDPILEDIDDSARSASLVTLAVGES